MRVHALRLSTLIALWIASGCGTSSTASLATTSSPQPTATTPSPSGTPVQATRTPDPRYLPAPNDQIKLTGYAATDSDWEANHQVDPDKVPGSAYLPVVNGGDKYSGVQHYGGHVTAYNLAFAGIPARLARNLITSEVPKDAHLDWDKTLASCEVIQYTSPTVASALGYLDKTGTVQVSLTSNDTAQYDSAHVDTASFLNLSPEDPASTSC